MSNGTVLFTLSRNYITSLPGIRSQINNIGKRWLCAATSHKQNQSSEASPKTDGTSTATENTNTESTATETEKPDEELAKQIDQLKEDLAGLKDKYQRSLADRENVRRRLEKQVADAKLYGIQSFCKDILEVTDVFRKALGSVSSEQLSEGSEQLRSLYDGLSMTETQLLTVFRRNGLTVISLESGGKFDPSWQEAMFEVPSDGTTEAGTVAHVLRPGWKLHDRCIRSAQVGVVKQ